MNIKYILGALVVILLISNIFFIYELQFSNQSNSEIIGDKSFELPDNYSSYKLEISNGVNKLYVLKLGNITMDSAIKEYKTKHSDNFKISVSEFDSKFPSKKTVATAKNSSIIKYWFEIDNNLYQIQFFNNAKNEANFNDLARNIINSMS